MKITLKLQQIDVAGLWKLARKERDHRLRRRIIGIAMVAEKKLSKEAIAKKLKTDSDRLRDWIQRYNKEGIDGLREKPGRGDKRTMTDSQETKLSKILEDSPRKVGINSNLWTGRAVQELLSKKNWFDGSLASAYVIIHRLGFTLQRPNRQSLEADPKAAKRFLRQLAGEKKA